MELLGQMNQKSYVMKLTWPIFIELILQMLVGNVDQIMVGRYSQQGVAAIGNANQILNLLLITFSVICTASTILISQYSGAKERGHIQQTYALSIVVNVFFSGMISALLLFGSPLIFRMMSLPQELMKDGVIYLRIIGAGMVLQAVYLTYTAFFRSNAMMKQTMVVSVGVNILNIFGNMILINGMFGIPPMGVAGAAISSVVSRLIGAIVIIVMFRKITGEKIKFSSLAPFPRALLKKLLGIGVPSAGESLSYSLSQVVIQSICNLLPVYVITTRVYANMFANFSYIYVSAISQAAQIVVGYLMGARQIDATAERVNATLKISLKTALVMSVLVCIFAKPLAGLMTKDQRVIELFQKIALCEIALELGRAVNIVMVRSLQAIGDIRFPVTICIISAWLVAVGLGWLFAIRLGWGLVGLWVAMALDECFRAFLFLWRWKGGKWKEKNLLGNL